mmetsp:Transcript_63249/g.135915  ORF Transcript_63249/g.135915 Transcript_63249/m.135915 type:complete len:678 (+) Transcript_63249:114-2147(+)
MEAELKAAFEPWERLLASAAQFDPVWLEVEEKQAQSLAAKKRLAEETKSFKRLSDTERLNTTPDLLKAYQAEIDALSKRAKFAEAAFAELLRALREAPEAAPAKARLCEALSSRGKGAEVFEERLRQKDAQIAKLSETARDLETELKTVTNQAATVRRLERQARDCEAGVDAAVAEARRVKDEEWAKHLEELRQEMVQQREQHQEAMVRLVQQKELSEDELDRLRQQRLEEQRLAEQAALARAVEVDALNNDLEKLQAELDGQRLQPVEHREAQGSVKVLQSLLDGVQKRAADLERECAELRRQLAEASGRAERREVEGRDQQKELASLAAAKDAEIQSLREQLSLRPSFDEVAALRQQLRNVDVVELADSSAAATDLERRLLQKQRALEGQLSEARVRAQELENENKCFQARLQAAEDESLDLRRLVKRLEAELGGASGGLKAPAPAAAEPPPLAALLPTSPAGAGALAAVGAVAAVGADHAVGTGTAAAGPLTVGEAPTSAAGVAMPSMLDIVAGQRDRFRERAGDLEQDRDRWRAAAEQERKRAETFHADNVKLVERARYLQSFQPKQGGPGRGRARGGTGKPGGADADLEGRYSAAYEDGISLANPFEQFREDEKARRVASMNAGERVLVVAGTLILKSKLARTVTIVYVSALHLLIFFVLFSLAHRSTASVI